MIQREKEDSYTMFGLANDPEMQCNTKDQRKREKKSAYLISIKNTGKSYYTPPFEIMF